MCRKDDMEFPQHVGQACWLAKTLRWTEEYLASWREGTSWPPTALWAASFSSNKRLLVLASLRPSTAASSSSAAVRLFQSDRMSALQTGGHTLSNSVYSSESAISRVFRTVAVGRHT